MVWLRGYGDTGYGDTLLNPQTPSPFPPNRSICLELPRCKGPGIPCPRPVTHPSSAAASPNFPTPDPCVIIRAMTRASPLDRRLTPPSRRSPGWHKATQSDAAHHNATESFFLRSAPCDVCELPAAKPGICVVAGLAWGRPWRHRRGKRIPLSERPAP